MIRTWWVKRLFGARTSPIRRTNARPAARPRLTWLEDRVVPAFDLTLSSLNATVGVTAATAAGTTTFTATATGANLNWNDIYAALNAGNNIVVDSGSTGTEAGNITDTTGFQLTPLSGTNLSLTIQSGSGTGLVGDISIEDINFAGTNSSITLSAHGSVTTGFLSGGTFLNPVPLASASITAATGSVNALGSPFPGPIDATNLAVSAATGIGTTSPLLTQASNLEAQTGTGGISISNTGDLAIGGVTPALAGVRVTGASGDINLTNAGAVSVRLNGEIVKGPGNVTITATGAAADIVTGGTNGLATGAVVSTGGTTTLDASAGRDLLLGDPGSATFGDVQGGGSVVLKAARDVTIDHNTLVDAHGAGTVSTTAGRNASVRALSRIASEGGAVDVATGAGGTFTLTGSGGAFGVRGTRAGGNGPVTISADDVVVDAASDITAGTGVVTLRQAGTTARNVTLGGGAAGLGLSDAELARVTAGVLRIGRANNPGDVTIDGPVTAHAGYDTLHLISSGNVTESGAGTLAVTKLAVEANGVNLGAAGNAIVNVAGVAAGNFATAFNLVTGTSLNVATVDGVAGVRATSAAGGGIAIAGSGPGTSLTVSQPVAAANGNIAFGFDLMALQAAVNAGARIVSLQPGNPARPISLGAAAAGSLSLLQGDLGNVTAGLLDVGGNTAANSGINFGGAIAAPATWNTLILESGGAITNTNPGTDVTVADLAMVAANGIALDTAASKLAFNNAAGAVSVANTGAVRVDAVAGLNASSNAGTTTTLSAASPFTFAVNTTGAGTLTTTTTDDGPADADNITVLGGVTVRSTGGDVVFRSGDDVVINATATVKADVGNIDLESGFADTDGDGSQDLDGAVLAPAGTVAINLNATEGAAQTATGSITAVGLQLLGTGPDGTFDLVSGTNNVARIAADTAGFVQYRDQDDLAVDTVFDPATGLTTLGVLTRAAPVCLQAGGAGATLTVNQPTNATGGPGNTGGVLLVADNMTFNAAVGHAATGSVTLTPVTAGRTVTLGTKPGGTLGLTQADLDNVQAPLLQIGEPAGNPNTNTGNIQITAAVTGTSWTTLSLVTGGAITEAAGAGLTVANLAANAPGGVTFDQANAIGTLAGSGSPFIVNDTTSLAVGTVNGVSGFSSGDDCAGSPTSVGGVGGGPVCLSVTAAGGTITVSQPVAAAGQGARLIADDLAINAPVTGTSVQLEPNAATRVIDLGTDTAGRLGLTQAELNLIATPVLQVGIGFNTGGIQVTAPISRPAGDTLSLLTSGAITETGAGSLTVDGLAVRGAAGVSLPGANAIGTLAGSGGPFIVNDTTSLTVGTVNGIFGFGPGLACAGSPAPVNGVVGGPVCLTVAGGTLTVNQPITPGANNALLVADNMALNAPVGGTAVTLAPFTGSRSVTLDAVKGAGSLSLTQADLNNVGAPVLQLGLPAGVPAPLAPTAGNVTVNAAITNAGTGWTTLSLVTAGTITEGANTLTVNNLSAVGGAGVDLPGANVIGALAGGTAGAPFIVNDAAALTVGTVSVVGGFGGGPACAGAVGPASGIAAGSVCLTVGAAGGTLTVNQPINAAGAGNVLLVADNMALNAAVGNAAAGGVTLAPFTGGRSITLDAARVGTSLSLIQADLNNVGAPLLQLGLPAGVPAPLAPTAGNVTVNAAITNAGTGWTKLSITTAGTVTEAGAGSLTVPALSAVGDAGVDLSGANNVATLAGRVGTGKQFKFNDAAALTLDAVSAVAGFGGGAACAGGPVSVSGITAQNGVVDLTAAGITQVAGSAVFTGDAGGLRLAGTGAFKLDQPGNDTGTLAAAITGSLVYRDDTGLTVGTVGATTGVTATGDVTLCTATGDLTLAAPVGGATVRLDVAGNLSQTAGAVTATAALGARAGGSISLPGPNAAPTVALNAGGSVVYAASGPFAIGSVAAADCFGGATGITGTAITLCQTAGTLTVNSPLTAATVLLDSAGDITQTAPITAATLGAHSSGGSITLTDAGNDAGVVALRVDAAGKAIQYTDKNAVTVGAVAAAPCFGGATGVTTQGGDVTLTAGGLLTIGTGAGESVSAPGAVVDVTSAGATEAAGSKIVTGDTGGLRVQGTGDFILTSAGNDVGTLAAKVAGSLAYVDANDLTVGTVKTTAGVTDTAGSVALTTVSGDLDVVNDISATGTVVLTNSKALRLGPVTVSGNLGMAQSGAGPVVLTGAGTTTVNSLAGGVSFASPIDGATAGAQSLAINAAKTASLAQSVGATTLLRGLTVTGAAIALGGSAYQTQLDQTYNGPVVVSSPAVFFQSTGGNVTFNGTLDTAAPGGSGIGINAAGTVTFNGAVGDGLPRPASLAVNAGAIAVNGGAVTTTGDQSYTGPTTVGKLTEFATVNGGNVTFNGTLTGPYAVSFNTNAASTVRFGGAVDVGNLSVGGATAVATSSVRTSAGQAFSGPVTVSSDVVFASTGGGIIVFNEAGGGLTGGFNVIVNTSGASGFFGPVAVGSLTTDAPGVTVVAGGSVTTAGNQTFGDGVQVSVRVASFPSLGGGNVVFGSALIGLGATVNTAGTTAFYGPVSVTNLTTDAPGVTVVNTGSVTAADFLTFGDGVVFTAPVTFQGGHLEFVGEPNGIHVFAPVGGVTFGSALVSNCLDATVLSPSTTTFLGPVSVGSLTTDAGGTTVVAGGSITTCTFQSFGDDVQVVGGANFASTGAGNIEFHKTLTGDAVATDTAGATVFDGAVNVASLVTTAAGTTQVNGGSVTTAGLLLFQNPVAVAAGVPTTFASTGGGPVWFNRTLTGNAPVTVNNQGSTVFGQAVDVGSLATDAGGVTLVFAPLVRTAGSQSFGDGVAVGHDVRFVSTGGGDVTFGSVLSGPGFAVEIDTTGTTTFDGQVGTGSLATDAGGRTVIATGSVTTASNQQYGDAVVLPGTTALTSAGGAVVFAGPVTALASVVVDAVSIAFGSDVQAAGDVSLTGHGGSITTSGGTLTAANLTADAGNMAFGSNMQVAGNVVLIGRGGSIAQTGGALTTSNLVLLGAGTFVLNQPGNDVRGVFRADLTGGTIQLADANSLTIDTADGGIMTNNGDVVLRTGTDFTAQAAGSAPVINLGGGRLFVLPGLTGPANVVFDAEAQAARVSFGVLPDGADSPGGNDQSDRFTIRPNVNTPILVAGNAPTPPLPAGQTGDQLNPIFVSDVVAFNYDGQNGFYDFAGRQRLSFTGIDNLKGLSLSGFVVQTQEPSDANQSTQIGFAVRIVQSQQGRQLPGGLNGTSTVQNPFVVSPSLVNPAAPSAAPRIAFGDVNGDGVPDVILADGPGTAPLVTVINGLAVLSVGQLPSLQDLQTRTVTDVTGATRPAIMSQFFAYEPTFFGGVNVAVGDLNHDGKAEIVVGADIGGGPRVRVFDGASVAAANPGGPALLDDFFAYEPSFRGGVRVAVGDVNGDLTPDLVLGAGIDGGPRVTVLDGRDVAVGRDMNEGRGRTASAVLADFFAYDPNFRGGIFVAAGDFNQDGKADVLTGPGLGAPHVRVFDGATAPTGSPNVLVNFFALGFDPANPGDPLFQRTGPLNGVGGVAFTGLDPNAGTRNVLVGSARGEPTGVVEYGFDPGQQTPARQVGILTPDGTFQVTGANTSTQQPSAIEPLPAKIGYGATVGGFAG